MKRRVILLSTMLLSIVMIRAACHDSTPSVYEDPGNPGKFCAKATCFRCGVDFAACDRESVTEALDYLDIQMAISPCIGEGIWGDYSHQYTVATDNDGNPRTEKHQAIKAMEIKIREASPAMAIRVRQVFDGLEHFAKEDTTSLLYRAGPTISATLAGISVACLWISGEMATIDQQYTPLPPQKK